MKLLRRQFLHLAAGVAILAALSGSARAQAYPEHPVRVLIGFAAGSGPDIQGRTVSQEIGNSLGQPFYVETGSERMARSRRGRLRRPGLMGIRCCSPARRSSRRPTSIKISATTP